MRRRVLITIVVWGDWYLTALLELNLPSLLASDNLASFCAAHDVECVIMARAGEVARIRRSAAMQAVVRLMPVEFRHLPESELADPIRAHVDAWGRAMREARKRGSFILLLPPDVVWSNGSFAELARLLASGHTAIFVPFLRVISETFSPAVRQRRDGGSGSDLSLSGRELVTLGLQHLHPLMAAYLRDSSHFPSHAEMVVWPVRGEGLVVRALAREVFLYDPNTIAIDDRLQIVSHVDPQQVGMVDDSDRLFAVSLASLGKDIAWHLQPIPADEMEISRWWLNYDSTVNDQIAGTALRWHSGNMASGRWRRVERASGLWVKRLAILREGLRVWKSLIEAGQREAAGVLAAALRLRILARALRGPTGSSTIVFLPSDRILRDLIGGRGPSSLGAETLTRAIRHHVVIEETPQARVLEDWMKRQERASLRSQAGIVLDVRRTSFGLTVAGQNILQSAQRVGRHVIYRIDGVLDPELAPQGAGSR
jgi:hypothetical protein